MRYLFLCLFLVGCGRGISAPELPVMESYLVVSDGDGMIEHQIDRWPAAGIGAGAPMIQIWATESDKFGYVIFHSVPMSLGVDGRVYAWIEPNQDAIIVVRHATSPCGTSH